MGTEHPFTPIGHRLVSEPGVLPWVPNGWEDFAEMFSVSTWEFAMGTEPSSLIPDFALGFGTESFAMGAERDELPASVCSCSINRVSPLAQNWRLSMMLAKGRPGGPDGVP